MIKLGVLGSTSGTDLQAIFDAIKDNELVAEVGVVISNNENAYILERAKNHDVPGIFISHKEKTRIEFDLEITSVLQQRGIELVLLIGFMRILSAEFCREWHDKILNVHPSLLPKYAGGMDANVHKEVLHNGDKETGCTIHFVTEEVDGGPILIQKKCSVDPKDTVESLKRKIQQLEGLALIEAINMIANK